ncbi:hypothetical protein C8J57DRAFT_638628 [Mycena rebaudengoi]|nr:hypothetical protein C8J57DRAFT_638628 [Mycena rebaudengoi]
MSIPLMIPDPLESIWGIFISSLARTHSPVSACHAATEVFVVGDEIITLIAALREELDENPNFCTDRNANSDFHTETIVVPAPYDPHTSPAVWLKYQASAGAVENPRMKSALWTFGALPYLPHLPTSTSYRWLKQTWLSVAGRDGLLNVMNVSSGEGTMPLPRSHELRGRLTHPANMPQRWQVHATIDEEYETIIKADCEDWIIVLLAELAAQPIELRPSLFKANLKYMCNTMVIEATAFKAAGHLTCPHARRSFSCAHQQSTFEANARQMRDVCLELMKSQVDKQWTGYASVPQRNLARQMGWLNHKCRHAYGLLTDAEYDQYHKITFPALTRLRPLLTVLPVGIIWNYIPVDLKAKAVSYRLQNPYG